MNEEKQKAEFPKVFDKCPHCGSEERLGMQYIQQMKKEGSINKDAFNEGPMMQVNLFDPAHPPAIIGSTMKIKAIAVFWDVCGGCGAMYCNRFDPAEAVGQLQQQMPGHGGLPPGLGFGKG